MNEREIFAHLFSLARSSDDTHGAVAAAVVRDGEILATGVSGNNGIMHAEHALLGELNKRGITIQGDDVVYTTLEPCVIRSEEEERRKMGDDTTRLLKSGVKKVIFAAADPEMSEDNKIKFREAGAEITQTSDKGIIKEAIEVFNSTCLDKNKRLPEYAG